MIKNGFYRLDFKTPERCGVGMAVVNNGRIQGWDNFYLFSGWIVGVENRLVACIKVIPYVNGIVSVFKTTGPFEMTFSGYKYDNEFELVGSENSTKKEIITVSGGKILELDG